MKNTLFALLSFSLLSHTLAEPKSALPKLNIGDSAEKVVEILGNPTGYMETGELGIYYFELGSVHMKSGKVTSMNLISHESLVTRKEAEAEARELNRIKGEELLVSIKADDLFSVLPAEDRLIFWENFRRDYPEVDIYILYTTSKIEASKIVRDRQEEERIASLERRVRNAEFAADRAVKLAETQRVLDYSNYYNRSRGRYYATPYIIRRNNRTHVPPQRIRGSTSNSTVGLNLDFRSGTRISTNNTSRIGHVVGPTGTMTTGTYLMNSR